jgi:hypothetical protein
VTHGEFPFALDNYGATFASRHRDAAVRVGTLISTSSEQTRP